MSRSVRCSALILALTLALPGVSTASFLIPQALLSSNKIPQFVEPLPTHDASLDGILGLVAPKSQFWPYMLRTAPDNAAQREILMEELYAKILPDSFYAKLAKQYAKQGPPVGAANGALGTLVWSYRDNTAASANISKAGTLSNAPVFNDVTYLGPTMLVPRGIHDNVWYKSRLSTPTPGTPSLLQKYVTVDQSLKWADPFNTLCYLSPTSLGCPAVIGAPYTGPVPVAVHFHGTESPGKYDGGPDEWFTQECGDICEAASAAYDNTKGFTNVRGPAFVTNQFFYENQQEPGTFFYHDHGLGITRNNVFSGLAAGYLILDNNTSVLGTTLGAVAPATKGAVLDPATRLPEFPSRWMPLVLQDRLFDANGQLVFPDAGVNPVEHPFWIPEFFGDVIVVNGKSWPYLTVAADRYRFSVVNGSNARVYNLFFTNPGPRGGLVPTMWIIGTEQGYLDKPVPATSLLIATGERYDIVVDFSNVPVGTNLILSNNAPTPYPVGVPVKANLDGTIMQFRVSAAVPAVTPASTVLTATTPIRAASAQMVNIRPATYTIPSPTYPVRRLTLNEELHPISLAPLEMLVNNSKYKTEGGGGPVTPGPDVSEMPRQGDTEIWEIINLTVDAHPLHTHLTAFQLLDRQPLNAVAYEAYYISLFPGGVFTAGTGPPLPYNSVNGICLPNTICGGNPDPANAGGVNTLIGTPIPATGAEVGWKDTVRMDPGQVTRILVRLAPTDHAVGDPASQRGNNYYSFDPKEYPGYVWHCHIVDHEDNEMMRPLAIKP